MTASLKPAARPAPRAFCSNAVVCSAIGVLFPIVATLLEAWQITGSVHFEALLSVQRSSYLLWIIDLAPLALGLAAYLVSSQRFQAQRQTEALLKALVEREGDLKHAQRLTQEALHRSRVEGERAQEYLDIAGTMLLAMDTDGRVTLINPMGCEVLGRSEPEVVGRSWFELVPPEGREAARGVFRDNIAGQVNLHEYAEHEILTRAGERRLIAWNNRVLFTDDGQIRGTLSSGVDITESRAAERVLERSERKLNGMIASMDEGVVFADADGIVRTVNPYFCEFIGLAPAQIIGHPFSDFHPPGVRDHVHALIEGFRQGTADSFNIERKLADHHVIIRLQSVREEQE